MSAESAQVRNSLTYALCCESCALIHLVDVEILRRSGKL